MSWWLVVLLVLAGTAALFVMMVVAAGVGCALLLRSILERAGKGLQEWTESGRCRTAIDRFFAWLDEPQSGDEASSEEAGGTDRRTMNIIQPPDIHVNVSLSLDGDGSINQRLPLLPREGDCIEVRRDWPEREARTYVVERLRWVFWTYAVRDTPDPVVEIECRRTDASD